MVKRLFILAIVFCLLLCFGNLPVSAGELHGRSLLLQNPLVSATTPHRFSFTIPAGTTVGSIGFEYCDSPLLDIPCVATSGVAMTAVSLTDQVGVTDFAIASVTTNRVVLGRTASVIGSDTDVAYELSGATNPDYLGQFYVRISTFASIDGTGVANNASSIAATTVNALTISAEVPPILEFCAAETIPTDCASAQGNFLELGNLKPTKTTTARSQFLAKTNAAFGYAVTINGGTLSSGTNYIPAMLTNATSVAGSSQFGLNLVKNTEPDVGSDPDGGSALPSAAYAIPNSYHYVNGDTVATSNGVTDDTRFTVSYIVNVASDQAPGVYNTSLTYTATATF